MKRYYMFHKPRGCITARTDSRSKTVMDYFPENVRGTLFPIGRLDKDTEGLLLITDDGELCYNLMMPEKKVSKTYFFWALGTLSEEKHRELECGARIYPGKDDVTAPARLQVLEQGKICDIRHLIDDELIKTANRRPETPVFSALLTITEGKKHQVKRMLRYAGCKVAYLKRIRISSLELDGSLPAGKYRALTEDELALLKG